MKRKPQAASQAFWPSADASAWRTPTLRRRFPDICAEVAVRRARPALPAGALDTTGYETLQKDVARLRRDNQDLTENLEMAIANIQRLTIENHRLRQALEEAHKVARLPTRRST